MYKADELQYPGGSKLITSHAADIGGAWASGGRRSLIIYSTDKMKGFSRYLRHFHKVKFATEGEQIYVEWGVYNKTWKGKSEVFDSLNLRHNGWVEGIVKRIPGPSFSGASIVKKVLSLGLIKTRYFLRISPRKGGTTMHSQTFSTPLFSLVNDAGKSFTLGAVGKQLQHTELYNIVAFGDDRIVWMQLQEMFAKGKFNEIKRNPAKLF